MVEQKPLVFSGRFIGRKGTPAPVEPAGSFTPQDDSAVSEAAGSAAANTTPEAEAAGSAAARPPRGSEGRGRAGKHVAKKLEKRVFYEAQDLCRSYTVVFAALVEFALKTL